MPEDQEQKQTVWNADGALINLIFDLKAATGDRLSHWDLDNAYWRMRDYHREADAALDDYKKEKFKIEDENGKEKEVNYTQTERMDVLMKELTDERITFLKSKQQEEDYSRFFLALENFYITLSRLLQKNGIWLRKTGEDPNQAFRQR